MEIKQTTPLAHCLLKFASDVKGAFSGYASTFNTVDAVNDTMLPGAFAKSLAAGRSIKMFLNHAQNEVPVGDWVSLQEDAYGLKAEGLIDLNHIMGPTAYSALKRGAMDGLSIGFRTAAGDFEQKSDGGRNFTNLDLMEISLVSFPCEGQARISAVKADLVGLITPRDYEHYLRDVGGFSKSMATAIVSQLMKLRGEPVTSEQAAMDVKLQSVISEFSKRFK